MAGKRSYGDPCGIARALDVLGERWALLVVRELVLGPKRFTDLRAHLPGIATDVLSQRLRQLERAGVLSQTTLPAPASGRAYELTPRGRDLEPVLHALGRWGSQEGFQAVTHEMTVDAFAVALATVFDPGRSGGLDAAVVLDLGGDRVVAQIHDGTLEVRRGEAEQPDARIESSVAALREVLWRGRPLSDAESDGSVVVHGLRTAVRRFLKSFPPPIPARGPNP
ncbi:MAG: winged helix-turn-helix transcriptional regulator [Nocardioides sp.]|nr:winged helix-turn-helix transcriptional regulator [Nocardioides sp.]